jgi:hypothetical protein
MIHKKFVEHMLIRLGYSKLSINCQITKLSNAKLLYCFIVNVFFIDNIIINLTINNLTITINNTTI